MARKYKVFFCILGCLLTILSSIPVISAENGPPMMSPGIGPSDYGSGGFVSAPAAVEMSFYVPGMNSFSGYTVDPMISIIPANSASLQTSWYSYYLDEYHDIQSVSGDFTITDFQYHNDITLNTDGIPTFGEVRCYLTGGYYTLPDVPSSVKFKVRDFYSWTDPTNPNSPFNDFGSKSNVRFKLDEANVDYTFDGAHIVYSEFGSTEVKELYVDPGDIGCFDRLDFELDGSFFTEFDNFFQLFYIHSFEVVCTVAYPYGDYFYYDAWFSYCFFDDFRRLDVEEGQSFDSENPAVPLLNYTAFLGSAVSGFLDLEIFPNFTLGGIVMTVIAFVMVIWFLKIFAGG